MANEQEQRWIYVRSSAAFKRRMWLGSIFFLGGGLHTLSKLDNSVTFFEAIFAGSVCILFGAAMLWSLTIYRLKFNQERVILNALPFWRMSFSWSDLTAIRLDEDGRPDSLLFGPKRPLELSKPFRIKFPTRTTTSRTPLYFEPDTLELTALAQRKLEENARTS